ncbi:MAG: ATP-binding SpoIIE family protein phosphatase [Planctomycetota bacterium]
MIDLGTIPITQQSSIIEARNKLRLVTEALAGDEVAATRVATGVSLMTRMLLRQGVSPRLEVGVEADPDKLVLWLTFVDSEPVPEGPAVALFDKVCPMIRAGERHERRVAMRLPTAGALKSQAVNRLQEIVQKKGREELMAEVQARNLELQESLENLRRTTSAKERMESELNIGQEIQMSMLPLEFPPFPDRHEFTIFAKLIPAREVGGDFYDFFFIDDDHLCVCVGDVAGKGVPSALFMAVTRTLIKATAKDDASPASILTRVNDELSERNESCMFVTVFVAILNVDTGLFRYTNAGHNPPYIRHADGTTTRLAERHGPVIGGMAGLTYAEDELVLAGDDLLVMYTDGVTEAMSPTEQLYTEKRLAGLIGEGALSTVEDAVRVVLDDIDDHAAGAEQSDDITVLAVRYQGPGTDVIDHSFDITVPNQLTSIEAVNDRFNAFAAEAGLPDEVRRRINMVFDELLNNVISYGFDDEREHAIEVHVGLERHRLVIELMDDGRPFNPFGQETPDTTLPLEARRIGGLGIHLVQKVMDEVSYERRIDKNLVKLVKRIESP